MNLTITPEGHELRQRVGVVAWVVLEELCLNAEPDAAGGLVAVTNVRRLAEAVGVSKDTAARAVRRLAAAGVVERGPGRRAAGGVFAPGVYRVDLTDMSGIAIGTADARTRIARPTQPASAPRVARPPLRDKQATLFDLSTADA